MEKRVATPDESARVGTSSTQRGTEARLVLFTRLDPTTSSRTRNEWWAPEIREKNEGIYIYIYRRRRKEGVNAAKKGTPWRFEIELR